MRLATCWLQNGFSDARPSKRERRKSLSLRRFCCGQSRDRTGDLRIFSPSLYQLSYLSPFTSSYSRPLFGTFQPLRAEKIEEARLHTESFTMPPETDAAIQAASRVVAVGTTSVRAIESEPRKGETSLFIYPGYQFRRTGALLTNFHLPRSSLLVLVCAFAGRELTLAAYRHAVEQRYRFFSYGDCALVL